MVTYQASKNRQSELEYNIGCVRPDMEEKLIQKFRGYLNYYLSFKGKVQSLVIEVIREETGQRYFYAILEVVKIKFRDPPE